MMEESGSLSSLDEYKRVRGERKSFEELAVMFEGSTASGAERAYRRAVEKLTVLLVETSTLHAVRLKRKSVKRAKKKIAAAVYEYQADCGTIAEIGYCSYQDFAFTAKSVRMRIFSQE